MRMSSLGEGAPSAIVLHMSAVERMVRARFRAGESQQCRHYVNHMQRRVDDAGLELGRPIHESRDTNATLAQAALAAAEQGVVGRGLLTLLDAALLGVPLLFALRAAGEETAGRAAVVAREEDDGVVAQPFLVELGDNASDPARRAR